MTPVNLTSAAISKFWEAIHKDSDESRIKGIRIGVRGGGCSGYSYTIDYQKEEAGEEDVVYMVGPPTLCLQIYIDQYSAALLEGTTIDYEDKLMGGGFAFNNPGASRTCGCGSSFSA